MKKNKNDPCWKNYIQLGTKDKGGKKVPNCVPVKEETDTSDKNQMAENQLYFIAYAAEEIIDFIEDGGEVEEWYQNKLSKVHSEMETLHSYVEGEMYRTGMKEEAEVEEAVKHDRYIRVHGKKAKGEGTWLFTSKRFGNPTDYELAGAKGTLAAAGKIAAKQLGVKDVYVMEHVELDEVLDKDADAGDYVRDFRKSDAPQFKGKSKEKRGKMAIAAAYMATNKKIDESYKDGFMHGKQGTMPRGGSSSYGSDSVKFDAGYKAGRQAAAAQKQDVPLNKKYTRMTLKQLEKLRDDVYKKEQEIYGNLRPGAWPSNEQNVKLNALIAQRSQINAAIQYAKSLKEDTGVEEAVKHLQEDVELNELKSATLKSFADKRMASFDRNKGIMPGSKEHKQWKMAQKAYDKAAKKMPRSRSDLGFYEETIIENVKKVASKLSSSKDPSVKKLVASMNSGKEPSAKEVMALKGESQDAVVQAFAEVIGPEETMKRFGIKEEKKPTSALGKALYRSLSREKKASPAQVQRNKERWAKIQANKKTMENREIALKSFNDFINESSASYEKDLDPKKKIVVKGVMGAKSKPFKKVFRNMAAYDKWTDSDAFGNYEVYEITNE